MVHTVYIHITDECWEILFTCSRIVLCSVVTCASFWSFHSCIHLLYLLKVQCVKKKKKKEWSIVKNDIIFATMLKLMCITLNCKPVLFNFFLKIFPIYMGAGWNALPCCCGSPKWIKGLVSTSWLLEYNQWSGTAPLKNWRRKKSSPFSPRRTKLKPLTVEVQV